MAGAVRRNTAARSGPLLLPGRFQWILLVVLGPPFYAIGNYVGGRVLKQRAGATGGNLSVAQTLFAILVMLTLYAVHRYGPAARPAHLSTTGDVHADAHGNVPLWKSASRSPSTAAHARKT